MGPNEEWRLLKSNAAGSFIRWFLTFFLASVFSWRGFRPQEKVEIQSNSTWIGPESL